MNAETQKEIIREKYTEVATSAEACCSSSCGCGAEAEFTFAENYDNLEGYLAEADLGLGCGLPTELAQIKAGNTVLDLGSGAGNDCFVARSIVGETGNVIGVDFTKSMIKKARANALKLGLENVKFRLGEIEDLPIEDETADVIVSNCVLNLVPNKEKAFAEAYRVLKTGGHFSVSDMVLKSDLPEGLKNDASQFAGCVATAIDINEYLGFIEKAGFTNIQIQKSRKLDLPDTMLHQYFNSEEMEEFKTEEKGLFSINVYAEK